MFFRVWKQYGLRRAVTIELIETKQISPDKHLFGHSHFVSNINSSNVVIQLGKIPSRLSHSNRRDCLSKQANKISAIKMNDDSRMHMTNNNKIMKIVNSNDDECETPIATNDIITDSDQGLNLRGHVHVNSRSNSMGVYSTADGSCYGEGENDQKNNELEGQESILSL